MNKFRLRGLFLISFLTGLNTSFAADLVNGPSIQHGVSLSGTSTVGDSFSDFENVNSAFDAIATDGISGPVVLYIVSGIHQVHATLGELNRFDQPGVMLIIQSEDEMNPATLQHDTTSASDNWDLK